MGSPLKHWSPFHTCFATVTLFLMLLSTAYGHDIWIEVGTPIVREGDTVKTDLFLGNHGNNHRDFKQLGKVDPKNICCKLIAPDGTKYDFGADLIDTRLDSKEGCWTAQLKGSSQGLHMVAVTSDQVVKYAPTRSIKCAKTYFLVTDALDRPSSDEKGFDRLAGVPFELVPLSNPVAPTEPGTPIKVKLLFKGKPMADTVISFIPRGVTLAEDFDEHYERRTDAEGTASFEPESPNDYLIVAHHNEPKENGDGFENTKYSATLTVKVTAKCDCCDE